MVQQQQQFCCLNDRCNTNKNCLQYRSAKYATSIISYRQQFNKPLAALSMVKSSGGRNIIRAFSIPPTCVPWEGGHLISGAEFAEGVKQLHDAGGWHIPTTSHGHRGQRVCSNYHRVALVRLLGKIYSMLLEGPVDCWTSDRGGSVCFCPISTGLGQNQLFTISEVLYCTVSLAN